MTHMYDRGTLIGFECGQYSDFRFNGMLVTLKKLDLKKAASEYVAEREKARENKWQDANDYEDFMGWLVSTGRCAPIDYSTVYLGSYGAFDDELYKP